MFMERTSSFGSTSSSSPDSSPPPCFDSSPASSPSLEPMSLDSPTLPIAPLPDKLDHPLAASTKGELYTPRLYEKKYVSPENTPPNASYLAQSPTPNKRRQIYRSRDSDPFQPQPGFRRTISENDRDLRVWEDSINNVFDTGKGHINLSDMNLTLIPKKISDLRDFVVLPAISERVNGGRLFTRVTTAPPGPSGLSRSSIVDRTRSIADASVGLDKDAIHLYLSRNRIRSLPSELFSLKRMTVLILRANALTYIPPEIAQLVNLCELNLGNNQIKFLPAEMLKMTLKQLNVNPNPFIASPTFRRSYSRTDAFPAIEPRIVSPTTHTLPRVTPLTEICLRRLFSPSTLTCDLNPPIPNPPSECLLSHYDLKGISPEHRAISENIKDIFNACVPGSIPNTTDSEEPTFYVDDDGRISGIGRCPSEKHASTGIFARHAEERYTWEDCIGGVKVGGLVPMRWRGCQWGCLDFLGASDVHLGEEPVKDEDEDVVMEEDEQEEVVRLVHFDSAVSGAALDFED